MSRKLEKNASWKVEVFFIEMRKVSEVRLDEDNFVYTVCDDLGIKVILLGILEIIEESRF